MVIKGKECDFIVKKLTAFIKSIDMNSIRSKILVISLVGVVIPMTIIGIVSFSVTSGILKAQISKTNLQNIVNVNQNLELVLKETDKSAKQLLKNRVLNEFMNDSNNNRFRHMKNYDFLQKKKAVESILKNYIVSRTGTVYINLSLSNIQVSAKSEIDYKLDYINLFTYDDKKYYNDIKKNGEMYSWEDGRKSIFDHDGWILYNQVIYDENTSKDIGVLSIVINKSYIVKRLQYNNIYQGRGLFAVIREGSPVIIISDSENYSNNPDVQRILSDMDISDKKNESSVFIDKYLVSHKYSSYADWTIVKIIPTSVVTKGAGKIELLTIVVIVACILLAALFATILSNKVVNPIKRLIAATKKMEQGDLDLTAEDINITKKSRIINFILGSDTSFRVKVARCLIIIFVFPVLVLIIISYTTSLKVVEKEFRLATSDSVSMMNLNLQLKVSSVEQDSKYLLTDPLIQGILAKYNKAGKIDLQEYGELENRLMQSISYENNLMYIGLYSLNGKNIYSTTNVYFNKNDIAGEDWYRMVSGTSGEAALTETYTDNLNNSVFSCARKVNSLEPNIYLVGEPLGYILMSYNENYLYNIYSSFVLKNDRDFYLVNRDGTILSSKNKQLLGSSIKDIVPGSLNGSIGSDIQVVNGKRSLVLHEKAIGVKDWKLVAIVPLDGILEYNKNILVYNIYILTLSLFAIILMSILISLRMSKPINKLKADMKKVGQGNMEIDTSFPGKDEISQFGVSFVNMVKRLKGLINENFENQSSRHRAELGQKEAEMSALQAQINPHFLYNTLESINWIAIDLLGNENDISKTVKALSNLFRSSMDFEGKVSTIGKQLEDLENYIFIQKLRHGERISVSMEIDEAIYPFKALRLILQPLVENSINHGLRDIESGGRIVIKGWQTQGKVYFKIIDNGCGISSEKLEELRTMMESQDIRLGSKRIGLVNTNSRIKAFYGNEFGISIEGNYGGGTQITVIIPLVE